MERWLETYQREFIGESGDEEDNPPFKREIEVLRLILDHFEQLFYEFGARCELRTLIEIVSYSGTSSFRLSLWRARDC